MHPDIIITYWRGITIIARAEINLKARPRAHKDTEQHKQTEIQPGIDFFFITTDQVDDSPVGKVEFVTEVNDKAG